MITVHNLEQTRAIRIAWLLEELGVEYNIKNYKRDDHYHVPPEFLKIYPVGLSPFITDGDLVLGESGAIIEYILQKYGNNKLRPPAGTPEWIQYQYWFHFAEGSFMPVLFLQRVFNKFYEIVTMPGSSFIDSIKRKIDALFIGGVRDKVHNILIAPRLAKPLDYAEETLKKNQWFAGNEFTAADIQMAIPLIFAGNMKELNNKRPKVDEFIKRVQERPAYKKAAQKTHGIEKGWID